MRIDIRKHTRHVLRAEREDVEAFLMDARDPARWQDFERKYVARLEERLAEDSAPFEALAERARGEDVNLGCSCPTAKQPNVHHCHTVLALRFMKIHFGDLDVRLP